MKETHGFYANCFFTQVVYESFTYILSMVKRTWTSGDDVTEIEDVVQFEFVTIR